MLTYVLLALVALPLAVFAQTATRHAKGTFDVKIKPATVEYVGRMLLDKEFHGDLQGTAKGEMLTAMTAVKDSAVYVAVETVTARLDGREGTFALHHTGIMDRGTQNLTVTVVPDSGTGGLVGIKGKLVITITEGKHFYDLEYSLPDQK